MDRTSPTAVPHLEAKTVFWFENFSFFKILGWAIVGGCLYRVRPAQRISDWFLWGFTKIQFFPPSEWALGGFFSLWGWPRPDSFSWFLGVFDQIEVYNLQC